MTEDTNYDWSNSFEELVYFSKQRGRGDKKFSTCLTCIKENLAGFFNKDDMIRQGKTYGIEVIFVPCEKHDGITAWMDKYKSGVYW